MKSKFFIILGFLGMALSGCQSTIAPQTADGIGNMYMANNTMFAFKPGTPNGWVFGQDAGPAAESVHATFHPAGGSFENSQAVMYIQSQSVRNDMRTLEDAAKSVIKGFRKDGHKNFGGKKIKTITARTGIPVPIWEFRGDNFGNIEASGYMMGNDEILAVVLSARNEKAYQEAFPSFEALIRSYAGTISQTRQSLQNR